MKLIIGICCLLLLELFAVGAEEMQGKEKDTVQWDILCYGNVVCEVSKKGLLSF